MCHLGRCGCRRTVEFSTGVCRVLSVVFSGDAGEIAFGGATPGGGALGVFSLTDGNLAWTREIERSLVRRIAYLSNDSLLIAGLGDGCCLFCEAARGAPVKLIRCHRDAVTDLCVSSDGSQIATTGKDGFCRVWPVGLPNRSSVFLRQALPALFGIKRPFFSVPEGSMSSVVFLGPSQVLSGDVCGNVHLWDASSGEVISSPLSGEGPVASLKTSGDGMVVLVMSAGDRLCRILERQSLFTNTAQCAESVRSVFFLSDPRALAVVDRQGGIQLLDLDGPDWRSRPR